MIHEDAFDEVIETANDCEPKHDETATVMKALYHALKGLGCFIRIR